MIVTFLAPGPIRDRMMRRRNPALLLALMIGLGAGWGANAQDPQGLSERAAELGKVQRRIAEVEKTLARDRGNRDSEARELRAAQREVAAATAELNEIRARVQTQSDKVEAIRDRQHHETQRLAEQRHALGQQVRLAYQLGGQAQTRLLLNQEDPAELSRVSTWFDYLNRARAARIATIRQQLQVLLDLKATLVGELETLTALRDEQQSRVSELDRRRLESANELAALESKLRSRGQELSQLQADERELRKLIESLQDALADVPPDFPSDNRPFAEQRGELPWPVRGKLLARFGQSKADGKLKWNGVWIAADEKAPVRAVSAGRVAYVGWMHRYGLILVIEHGKGYFTLYGHNASVDKAAGETVRAGETIAQVGATGGQERPGLYFEIRKGSDPVDPQTWLGK